MPTKPKTHRPHKVDYDKATRGNNKRLAFAAKVRSSSGWQKLRARHRREEPLCCDPFDEHAKVGLPGLNQNSHHIMPLATHPELAYDRGNIAPLCTLCHAKVERMEPAVKDSWRLFKYDGNK